MSRRKPAPTPNIAPTFEYVAAKGSPFSDDDAAVIGAELARIAEANKVEDLRSLDKHLVFEAVEADPNHPLRRFFDWDDASAARKQRISIAATLIRSVRIVSVVMGKRSAPTPAFFYAPDLATRQPAPGPRAHVAVGDLMRNDPAFMSALSSQVKQVRYSVERLEHLTKSRKAPDSVVELVAEFKESLDRYFGSISQDAAAEE
jgi:hypothetical protein